MVVIMCRHPIILLSVLILSVNKTAMAKKIARLKA